MERAELAKILTLIITIPLLIGFVGLIIHDGTAHLTKRYQQRRAARQQAEANAQHHNRVIYKP